MSIEDLFHKANTLREIGEVQTKAGQVTPAWERFEDVQRIPDNSLKSYTLLYLAKAQADAGNTEKALQAAHRMAKDTNGMNYAYFYIALTQTKTGDFEGAPRSFHAIADASYLKAKTTQEIAKALSVQGDHDSAFTWANSLSSPRERIGAFLGIAQGMVAY